MLESLLSSRHMLVLTILLALPYSSNSSAQDFATDKGDSTLWTYGTLGLGLSTDLGGATWFVCINRSLVVRATSLVFLNI